MVPHPPREEALCLGVVWETRLPPFQLCCLILRQAAGRSSAQSRSMPCFSVKLCLYTPSPFCLDWISLCLNWISLCPCPAGDLPTAPSKYRFAVPPPGKPCPASVSLPRGTLPPLLSLPWSWCHSALPSCAPPAQSSLRRGALFNSSLLHTQC